MTTTIRNKILYTNPLSGVSIVEYKKQAITTVGENIIDIYDDLVKLGCLKTATGGYCINKKHLDAMIKIVSKGEVTPPVHDDATEIIKSISDQLSKLLSHELSSSVIDSLTGLEDTIRNAIKNKENLTITIDDYSSNEEVQIEEDVTIN